LRHDSFASEGKKEEIIFNLPRKGLKPRKLPKKAHNSTTVTGTLISIYFRLESFLASGKSLVAQNLDESKTSASKKATEENSPCNLSA
jgi:hypothetical protein